MLRKILLAIAATAVSASLFAQIPTGGVKGTVVDRSDRAPIQKAAIALFQGATEVAATESDDSGAFLVEGLADGIYDMVVNAADYLETRVNVTVNDGFELTVTIIDTENIATVTFVYGEETKTEAVLKGDNIKAYAVCYGLLNDIDIPGLYV